MRKLLRRIGFWVPLLLVWAIPLVIVTVAFQKAEESEEEALTESLPEIVPVGERDRSFHQQVAFKFTFTEEPVAKINAAGTVTAIYYEPDKKLEEGAAIIAVDDVTVRAHRGSQPFHRDLSRGDAGKDVAELARYLSKTLEREVVTDRGDKFGYRLSEAVKEYQRKNGAAASGTFEKSYVLYLPDDIERLWEPTVRIGHEISAGSEFAEPAKSVASVQIEAQDGDFSAGNAAPPYVLSAGEVEFEREDLEFTQSDAQEMLAEIHDAELNLREGEEDNTSLLYDVSFAVKNPSQIGTLPPSAIYANSEGTFCIFEAPNGNETHTPQPIKLDGAEALEGEVSLTAVSHEYVGLEVYRAPQTLPVEHRAECG